MNRLAEDSSVALQTTITGRSPSKRTLTKRPSSRLFNKNAPQTAIKQASRALRIYPTPVSQTVLLTSTLEHQTKLQQ